MSKEQLKHIFEQSACLTPRQVKNYVSGKMVHEEAHVVEAHLLGCPLCSDAVEGIIEHKAQGALAAIEKPDAGFLSKHLGLPIQEIKAITAAPPVIKAGTYSTQPEKTVQKGSNIPWKTLAAAAGLITITCVAWFMRDSIFPHTEEQQLAQSTISEPVPAPEISYNATTTDTTTGVTGDSAELLTITEPTLQTPVTTTTTPAKTPQEIAAMAKKEAEKKIPLTDGAKKTDAAKALTVATQNNYGITESKPTAAAPATTGNTSPARTGNSFTGPEAPAFDAAADVAETKTETVTKRKVNIAKRASNGMDKADELYNSGKYKKALKIYQDEMYDSKSNKKDAATLMAAQCHIGLGQAEQAKILLNTLVNKNSVKKQQAQQLLTQMGE